MCAVGVVDARTAEAQQHHTVRAGQTLSQIARRYRTSVNNILAANRMTPRSMLRPGQVLDIPPRGVVYVQPGQTLSHIARENDCSIADLRRLNRLRRNSRIRAGQMLRLPGYEPREAPEREYGEPDEPGRARLLGRTHNARVQLVDRRGRVHRHALRQLGRVMKRDEDDPIREPDPRLAAVLAAISDHFGGRAITVVSGYRPARGYTSNESRHVHNAALDIRVQGVSNREVWDFCLSLRRTGCGYYPRSTFVHVDVRDREAQWVDWSRPGQRPRYGTLTGPVARRRGVPRPRIARRVTRPRAVPVRVRVID